METLNLIKNWGYDFGTNDEKPEDDGYLALGLVDRKKKTATGKLTDNEDFVNNLNYGIWFKCREQFHKVFTENDKTILYAHAGNLSENISEFVHQIESVLGINHKDQSKFFKTQRITITAIRPAKFWIACPMKRQLFTIFLRSGRNHKIGDNYQESLSNTKYTKETITAINLFLQGYTTFAQKCLDILAWNHHSGFVHQFTGLKEIDIKNILLFKK